MKSRFIDFEGIHGSGKSACAWNLHNNLNKDSVEATVFFEYHMDSMIENPCDIRMTEVMTAEEFDNIIREHSLYREVLRNKVKIYKEKCYEKLVSNKDKIYIDRMNYDEENEYIYRTLCQN